MIQNLNVILIKKNYINNFFSLYFNDNNYVGKNSFKYLLNGIIPALLSFHKLNQASQANVKQYIRKAKLKQQITLYSVLLRDGF